MNDRKIWVLMGGIDGTEPVVAFASKELADNALEVFSKAAPLVSFGLLELPLWGS